MIPNTIYLFSGTQWSWDSSSDLCWSLRFMGHYGYLISHKREIPSEFFLAKYGYSHNREPTLVFVYLAK